MGLALKLISFAQVDSVITQEDSSKTAQVAEQAQSDFLKRI